ncbi:inter-alpha-trypsin inhibitor heavy chain H3-like isoform X2 [Haliotis rufescens]|uniref:inter-alpha-trypsin inhibitor heavy chain H3-like isoform X2 n=1 Tax=Haliotis rufescens TaxID=6454 RepID=UPI00201F4D6A|nr:inter-alpha-trypsin inhibitor heavy chain H3-like isoform X2 [Haliotis rufescens]
MLQAFGHVTLALLGTVVYIGPVFANQLTVKSFLVRSHIRYRFASTVVASTVINDDGTQSREAVFEVVLPEEAFISNFSMTVDGEVYVGRVEEKQKALTSYQQAKDRGESAGYIKSTARHSNKFDVSVNLKPGSSVTFNLTYQQLLPRCKGMYEQRIHVNPGQLVREVKVEVFIEDSRVITAATTEFPSGENSNVFEEIGVSVLSPSPNSRYIVYNPSLDQQKLLGKNGVNKELLIKYDVDRDQNAGEVLVVDGYFVHFFAPENAGEDILPVPKDILFVLDISGSMSGTKIAQLKAAMTVILKELSKTDRFNIFLFDDRLKKWKTALVPVESSTIDEALDYVSRLEAEDSTNLNMALTDGISFMLEERYKEHTPVMFFLTDGQPTVGTKDPGSIAKNVERLNEDVVSLFGLAFGNGADYYLLKVVSAQNSGFARRIYEAADAADQVEGFYDDISTTVLRNLNIKYLNGTVDPDTLTTTVFRNVFRGNDVVVAGRMSDFINTLIGASLTADIGTGKLNVVLDNHSTQPIEPSTNNPYFTIPMDFASVIERSWAYLRIKDLLLQKRKDEYKNEKSDVDRKITELALKYNFVTPLTSMVATKPEQQATKTNIRGDDYKKERPVHRSHQRAYFPQASVPRYNSMVSRKIVNPAVAYGIQSGQQSFPSGILSGQQSFPSAIQPRPKYNGGGASSVRRYFKRQRYGMRTRPRTGPMTVLRTAPRIVPMTRSTIILTTVATTALTTVPTTAPTTVPTTVPTTAPTTVPTTGRTTGPTTDPTIDPMIRPSTGPRTGKGRRKKSRRKSLKNKSKKRNMRCKIVKMFLDGFGTTTDKQMCSRALRVQPGTFQIYPAPSTIPTESHIYVQATLKRVSSRVLLQEINIHLKDANMSYKVVMNTSDVSSKVWRTPDTPTGHVAIHKQATCRRTVGVARYFIMVHLTQPAGAGSARRIKRDIKGKIRRKLRKSLTAKVCGASSRVEKLNSKSKRLKGTGYLFQSASVVNL